MVFEGSVIFLSKLSFNSLLLFKLLFFVQKMYLFMCKFFRLRQMQSLL